MKFSSVQLAAGILLAAASSVVIGEAVQAQSVEVSGTTAIDINVPDILVVAYLDTITFNLTVADLGFPPDVNDFTATCAGTGFTIDCGATNLTDAVTGLTPLSGTSTFTVENFLAVFTNADSAELTTGTAPTFANEAGDTEVASAVSYTNTTLTDASFLPFTVEESNSTDLSFTLPSEFLFSGGNLFSTTATNGVSLEFTVAVP